MEIYHPKVPRESDEIYFIDWSIDRLIDHVIH